MTEGEGALDLHLCALSASISLLVVHQCVIFEIFCLLWCCSVFTVIVLQSIETEMTDIMGDRFVPEIHEKRRRRSR